MDQVRHTPAYRHTNTWHTNKVDAGETTCPDPEGDAMTFLDDCIAKVEDYRNQNDSTVTVSIRFIVHLVGDMHCPGHEISVVQEFQIHAQRQEYEPA